MRHTAAVRCSTRRSGSGEFSPLDELDRAFLAVAATDRLSLPGELVGVGEAEGHRGDGVPVDRVRVALAHPGTRPEVRTRIWREVVVRAQREGEPWGLVAAGFGVPVLRRVLSRLPRGNAIEAVEVEQEALATFVVALHAADPEDAALDQALVRAADRAAHRHVYAACRRARLAAHRSGRDAAERGLRLPDGAGRWGDEYQVLRDAVRAGVITCPEAQVIARSRLGGELMAALAMERGMSPSRVCRYRAAAEARLAAFLRDGSA
ncbi:hypothetical protein ACTWP5_29525 [Streptomyces sp. 4N509B]|uniref:hypothetical protein n=1 Tax=Streptomyces sp. 4N509B TaxID=3457413 RepID=UPI003FD58D5F